MKTFDYTDDRISAGMEGVMKTFDYTDDRISAGMDALGALLPDPERNAQSEHLRFSDVRAAIAAEDDMERLREEHDALQQRDAAIRSAGLDECAFMVGYLTMFLADMRAMAETNLRLALAFSRYEYLFDVCDTLRRQPSENYLDTMGRLRLARARAQASPSASVANLPT